VRARSALIGGQSARDPSTSKGLAPAPARQQLASALNPPAWLFGYFFVEIACQFALLVPLFAPARVVIRSAAFATSLLGVFLLRGSGDAHPSRKLAIVALGIVGALTFHPDSSGIPVSVATVLLNFAIVSPIFWVPRIRIDVNTVRALIFAFWAVQAASAAVGALQVYYPGRFQPAAASVLSDEQLGALQITLANGARVSRPMGLTDAPGGAGIGAAYCILLATGLLIDRPRLWLRVLLIASMCVGCFTLYLCQVRSLLVMVVISLIAMAAPLIMRGRFTRLATFGLPLIATAILGFALATAIGGDAVTNRLSTLIEDDPSTVYYSNRGIFLRYTFMDLLPQYPLGAGLGRWGMLRTYFGGLSDMSQPIWVEIQWTGWLLDGGIPLMIVQAGCLLLALREAVRLALRTDAAAQSLAQFAAMLAGYSVGAIALTFNSCPFASTMGLDFWLLNATLFAASRQLRS
jgi:hypothetical protein